MRVSARAYALLPEFEGNERRAASYTVRNGQAPLWTELVVTTAPTTWLSEQHSQPVYSQHTTAHPTASRKHVGERSARWGCAPTHNSPEVEDPQRRQAAQHRSQRRANLRPKFI